MENNNIPNKEEMKEAKRRHKEVLWNNRYYVMYKMVTVISITIVVCTILIMGNLH